MEQTNDEKRKQILESIKTEVNYKEQMMYFYDNVKKCSEGLKRANLLIDEYDKKYKNGTIDLTLYPNDEIYLVTNY